MKWCETRFEIFLSQTKLENDENKRNRLGWVGPTLIFYPLNFIFNVLTLRRLKRFFFLSFSFNLFEATKERKNLLSLSSFTNINFPRTYLPTYIPTYVQWSIRKYPQTENDPYLGSLLKLFSIAKVAAANLVLKPVVS